jgi:hypothetical protein
MLRHGYSPVTVDDRAPRPHERDWRHPSEISAEHRIVFAAEPPSRRLRAAAIVSGTTAVIVAIAIGIVIASAPTGPEVATVRSADRQPTDRRADIVAVPINTPTGDIAAMTVTGLAAADAGDGSIDGRAVVDLHGGGRVEARRLWSDQRIVIVATSPVESTAERTPTFVVEPLVVESADASSMTVALHGEHPESLVTRLDRVAAFADPIDGIDLSSVADGTPVVDGDGTLVALCSPSGSGVELLAFSPDAVAATLAGR